MRGSSRDSFYRFKELYDKGGELALQEISRRKPILKNRTAPDIEQAAVEMAIEQPAWGQVRVSEALKRRGLSISPAGVRCVWQRHDLTSMKHRLKALEPKMAQEGILLTESQIAALEKAKADKEAHGEFESECPGYLRGAGYLLCRHVEGGGAGLPADRHWTCRVFVERHWLIRRPFFRTEPGLRSRGRNGAGQDCRTRRCSGQWPGRLLGGGGRWCARRTPVSRALRKVSTAV